MTAEELEELLSPKPKEAIPQVPQLTIPAFTNSNTSNEIRISPAMYSTSSFSFGASAFTTALNRYESGRRFQSYHDRELSEEEKRTIMNAVVDYVNGQARGVRFDRVELEGLSRRIASFTESFMYRWFAHMIHPKIECRFNLSAVDTAAAFSITINDVEIGAVGVRTR